MAGNEIGNNPDDVLFDESGDLDPLGSGISSAADLREARKQNISGLLNNPNTRPKVLATFIGLFAILAGSAFYVAGATDDGGLGETASIPKPASMIKQPVAVTADTTPEYARLERQNNENEADAALRSGGSHLERPSAKPQVVQQQVNTVPVYISQPAPAASYGGNDHSDMYFQRMKDQFGKLAESWTAGEHTNVSVKEVNQTQLAATAYGQPGYINPQGQVVPPINPAGLQLVATQGPNIAPSATTPDSEGVTLIKAGKSYYGVTEIEANSDSPGPVVVTMLSGPYKGAKMIGEFKAAKESITVTLKSLTPVEGDTMKINALLVDPDRATKDLATEVDRHYFERYGLLMSAAFLQGFGEAASRANSVISTSPLGSTTTIGELDPNQQVLVAAGEAGRALSTEFRRNATIPNTIKLQAGTPVAVLFLEDVKE